MSSFRHVIMMRFTAGATQAQIGEMIEGLAKLPSIIPEIIRYQLGRDLRINDGNFDFAIVAEFADRDAYLVYRDHPDHLTVINERVKPILAERAAVQFEI
jgi:hypothetical protein